MRQQTIVVLALLVAAVSVVGAASYTQTTVNRDAGIQVTADNAALVGLGVGQGISDDSVKTTTSGMLVLNLDDEGQGVNGNATFNYGEASEASRTQKNTAFNLTNNDEASRTFDLSYAVTGTDGDTSVDNVKFTVYTGDGMGGIDTASAVTVSESTSQTVTLASGKKAFVYVEVDTDTGDLGSASDLSGTLTITAS